MFSYNTREITSTFLYYEELRSQISGDYSSANKCTIITFWKTDCSSGAKRNVMIKHFQLDNVITMSIAA